MGIIVKKQSYQHPTLRSGEKKYITTVSVTKGKKLS